MTTWTSDELPRVGARHEGRVAAGGVERDVAFVDVGAEGVGRVQSRGGEVTEIRPSAPHQANGTGTAPDHFIAM